MMQHALRLELSFPPDPTRIEITRQAVARCVAVVWADPSFEEALAMATAELVENAIKYGATGANVVGVGIVATRGDVVLTVSNAVDSRSQHVDALRARIAWMHGHEDARSAYLAALTHVYASGDLDSQESGLGLVRVAYEGGATVECNTETPGLVLVRARFRPQPPTAEPAP